MLSDISRYFYEDSGPNKCGCYIVNPEVLGINFKRALVPLTHLDYQLQIVNSLLNITLSQKYYNPTDKFLEVSYSQPITPESSVYKFEAEFQNVKIQGVIKEKEKAKKEYEQAKSQGKQTAIGNIDPDSKDILNFQVGNIPPKTQFIVSVSIMQELQVNMSSFYKVEVPSTISPRYINKVEEVAKVPEHQKLKEGKQSSGNPDFQWNFKIDLKTTQEVVFLNSPTHKMTLISQNQKKTETLLVMEKSEKPNKDFNFLFTTKDFHLPSYVLGTTDISSTVMLSFIPKFCNLEITDAYQASIEKRQYEINIENVRGDYVFFLDRSGSMQGTRIEKAKQSLILFLKSLPEDSYFNVVSFGNSSQKIFPSSMKNDSTNIQYVVHNVESMAANLGGTQIYDPLKQILEEKTIQGYPRHVFLLTDGQVSNTQGVIDMIKKKTKYARVHAIGIGDGASYSLIQGSAKSGKGKYVMISDKENPAEKIIGLLQQSLTPLISKVNLDFEKSQIQSIIPNPKSIPYILKDQVVNFFITFKGVLDSKKTFTFSYEDPIKKIPYTSKIQIEPPKNINMNQPFIDKMAHFKILKQLQDCAKQGKQVQDNMFYVKIKDFKEEATNYSIKHQILSQYTAFVCIGKELVDGKYQEYKNIGIQKIHVEQPRRAVYQMSGYINSNSNNNTLYSNSFSNYEPLSYVSNSSKNNLYYGSGRSMSNRGASFSRSNNQLGSYSNGTSSYGATYGATYGGSYGTTSTSSYGASSYGTTSGATYGGSYGGSYGTTSTSSYGASSYGTTSGATSSLSSGNYGKIGEYQSPKSNPINNTHNYDINSIIKMQQFDGSWKNQVLIEKLSKNPKQLSQLAKTMPEEIVITKLVILWINKNHPLKEYSLIIKKAISWLNKSLKEKSIEYAKLNIIQPL